MGDLGKIIVAIGFEKLPKVQKMPNLVTLDATPDTLSWLNMKTALIKLTRELSLLKNHLGKTIWTVFFEFGKGSNLGNLTTFILLMEQIFNALSDPN